MGLGLQEIKSTNGQKEAIAMVLFSSEEMANEIRSRGYGMYTEDGGGFFLECWKYVELERREIIVFSPTTVRTGNVCNERMKPRDISLYTDTR